MDVGNDASSPPQPLTELDALEQTLIWGNVSPTGPSSLAMVPSGDPMVLNRATPNLYFCGNCEEGFATKLISYEEDGTITGTKDGRPKTRLVCVPKFSETGEAILVNLQNLDVEVLRFKVDEDEHNENK